MKGVGLEEVQYMYVFHRKDARRFMMNKAQLEPDSMYYIER